MSSGAPEKKPPTLSVSTAALKAVRRLDQLAAEPGICRLLRTVDEAGNRYLALESTLKLEKVS